MVRCGRRDSSSVTGGGRTGGASGGLGRRTACDQVEPGGAAAGGWRSAWPNRSTTKSYRPGGRRPGGPRVVGRAGLMSPLRRNLGGVAGELVRRGAVAALLYLGGAECT